jgi:hypothetical protein
MFMRRETRPVAARRIDLVDHELVGGELGTKDSNDLTGRASTSAYFTLQFLWSKPPRPL